LILPTAQPAPALVESPPVTTLRATYRLQLHRDFPLADAEAIVPYLADLGISHVYASPITVARSGSMHGYDVIDPTRVNPELGGEDALRSLVAALRARGMGLIIDIVPNHMGVAGGENAWWDDVLRNGRSSRYASFFDIDWSAKPLLPILGARLEDVLAEGQVAIVRGEGGEAHLSVYGEHELPIRPEDQQDLPAEGDTDGLAALLDRQHYQLGWWRTADDELNWRRFFTISELAGLRQEEPEVFEATHALYFRLYGEGLIDGVRIDHVDGLADPGGYCRTLRKRLDTIERPADAPAGPAYIIVEKILGPGERLPDSWQIDGTSGYDFMEEVSALIHDPSGAEPLGTLWREFSGRELTYRQEELLARQQLLSWSFDGQFRACAELFAQLAASRPESRAWTSGMLRRALERLLWVFPVYRTYRPEDEAPSQPAMLDRVREAVTRHAPPGEQEVVEQILAWLVEPSAGDPLLQTARRRFQQLTAPIAAKAVEDTAFYRYGRLLSRNDVGFDAGRLAQSVEEFHKGCEVRARDFPGSMLATATHDHKRGEDVRARLAVLSGLPEEWRAEVTGWDWLAGGERSGVHPADRYMFYQTLLGAWPADLVPTNPSGLKSFAERIIAWQEKALREAKLRSSWESPDEAYEQACTQMVEKLLDPAESAPFLDAVQAFVTRLQGACMANVLAQVALKLTVPGLPDTYQGCELEDYSLVDPDNRRPVDYDLRRVLLGNGEHPKLALTHQLLTLHQEHRALFAQGDYRPLDVRGAKANHVIAFTRSFEGETLTCAIALRCAPALLDRTDLVPEAEWWEDTYIALEGDAQDRLEGAQLFATSPVHFSLSR
jgi:(1->4)-alpha-D-glucan 1-alpha-D-glucosylmutase